LYFGIRDLDDFEKEKIKENGIFHTSKFDDLIVKINSIITKNEKTKFHISWDVDSLDPTILDSTGCLADNGLQLSDIIKTVTHPFVQDKLIAFDIVEYNPSLGNNAESYKQLGECLTLILNSFY
jgi:arginase